MNQQLRDWAKEALETLEDNHDLVADNEKHRYVMMHLDVIKRGKALLEQPEPVQEPIYQMQMMDGKWIDQAKQSYEYNKAHGNTVRIVYTTPPAQPEPVFCEYCGGNDDADFGLPTDHCTDCARPQPAQPDGDKLSPTEAQPAPVQEEKQSEIFCGVDFADGVLSVSVLRRRPNDVAELLHSEQIDLPLSAQPADHDVEKAVAYLNGVHTGKQLAKRDLLKALERLLVVQDELCSIDHHGYCQSHYLDNVNSHGGCRVANARALVAKVRGKP
jgi:hypothetical protein